MKTRNSGWGNQHSPHVFTKNTDYIVCPAPNVFLCCVIFVCLGFLLCVVFFVFFLFFTPWLSFCASMVVDIVEGQKGEGVKNGQNSKWGKPRHLQILMPFRVSGLRVFFLFSFSFFLLGRGRDEIEQSVRALCGTSLSPVLGLKPQAKKHNAAHCSERPTADPVPRPRMCLACVSSVVPKPTRLGGSCTVNIACEWRLSDRVHRFLAIARLSRWRGH